MPRFSILIDRSARPDIRPVPDTHAVPGELYFVRNRRGDLHLVMCRLKADGRSRQLGPLPHGFQREGTIDRVPLGFTLSTDGVAPVRCDTPRVAIEYLSRNRARRNFVMDFR